MFLNLFFAWINIHTYVVYVCDIMFMKSKLPGACVCPDNLLLVPYLYIH